MVTSASTLATRDAPQRPGLSWWVGVPALVQFVALIGTASRYGYHPDELYFLACGRHPALGYPDQPALVPLLAAAMNHLDTGSLTLLRTPSAVAAAATTVLAGVIARE